MGAELKHDALIVGDVTAQQQRAAAVHVADRIGAEHPHPLDDVMPKLAGRLIAQDPAVRGGLLELLDALGLSKEQRQ